MEERAKERIRSKKGCMSRSSQHIARCMNALIDRLPDDQKKKVLIDRKVKQVHQQFAACVDPFILSHVNSVYLMKEPQPGSDDVSRETLLKLTVYVDNSMIAAELNAQRELVILKYRELFSLKIDEFAIKISRGPYLEHHPFRLDEPDREEGFRPLTPKEESAIEQQVSGISDKDVRASFKRLLKATKEHFPKE